MTRNHTTLYLMLLLVSLAGGCSRPAADRASTTADEPRFLESPCEMPGLAPTALPRLRCGTVEVPRRYEDPGAGTYRLAIAIIKSARQPARPDPLVIGTGGPGSATVVTIAPAAADAGFPFDDERDVILVDARGSGRSEPTVCGTADALGQSAPDEPTAVMLEGQRARLRGCLDAARERGIFPQEFGTTVVAADLDRVRRALGIRQWNYMGVSYDTLTGLALLEKYPATLRSVVLDSALLPAGEPAMSLDARFARAWQALLTECAASSHCKARHPDLDRERQQALQQLDGHPMAVTVPGGAGRAEQQVVLNRGDLEMLLFTSLYGRAATIPALLAAVNGQRSGEITPALQGMAAQASGISLLPFVAVACRDGSGPAFAAERGRMAGFHVLDQSDLCPGWTAPSDQPIVPRDSKVPVLVLGGTLDPITPPVYGKRMAELLGAQATFVEIPSVGHGVGPQAACAAAIVLGFIAQPEHKPDQACVTQVPRTGFL